jgi:hypothetical protein
MEDLSYLLEENFAKDLTSEEEEKEEPNQPMKQSVDYPQLPKKKEDFSQVNEQNIQVNSHKQGNKLLFRNQ